MAEISVKSVSPTIYYISKRQKQSLSYASPLVVYWDPLQDHCWNDKVCRESLSQCQSNFSSSPKLKNSIFGVIKVNYGQLGKSILGFRALKPLPWELP